MGNILDLTEHLEVAQGILGVSQRGLDWIERVKVFQDAALARREFTFAELEARINTQLAGFVTYIDIILTSINATSFADIEVWKIRVEKGMLNRPKAIESFAVDVDNGAGGSTITINQQSGLDIAILGVFTVEDVVEVRNAEDHRHNDTYTVSAVTDGVTFPQVITFASTMRGEDNANDESLVLLLDKR